MAAWDGVGVDDRSDGFLDQPGQDPVDEPDEGFVVDLTDPTGVDQDGVDQAGAGDAGLVAWTSLPEPAVAPAVIGYPAGEVTGWHLQEHSDTCAVATQEFILDGLTGVDHTESELLAVAQANGWYTPGAGTSMEDMGKILDYYGLSTEQHHNATLDDLQQALANGDGVMVGVDSDEIWTPGFDPDEPLDAHPGIPGQGADHAVQVIGLDYTDPVNPVVVLNDPGHPAGQGGTVPLETFLEAWEDSGNFLVTAHGSRVA